MKKFICLLLLFFWHAQCQAAGFAVEVPSVCKVNEKIIAHISTDTQLPASSFFRLELDCPRKPEGAKAVALMGYPESVISFSLPGEYECELEAGFVTKSSCAGAHYQKLGMRKLVFTVEPQ